MAPTELAITMLKSFVRISPGKYLVNYIAIANESDVCPKMNSITKKLIDWTLS
jgi:hypothetical protein